MFCVSQQFLYIRLTVPEEKNNNDDRHIKKRQNKSYCQFFFLPFLSLSLSPFLLFRVVAHKKKPRRKRRKKQQTIDQHHYRRHRHTRSSHHLASRSDHLLIFYIYNIGCVFFVVVKILLLQFIASLFSLHLILKLLLVCRQYPPNISCLIVNKIYRER
jgi:hypothetical protein